MLFIGLGPSCFSACLPLALAVSICSICHEYSLTFVSFFCTCMLLSPAMLPILNSNCKCMNLLLQYIKVEKEKNWVSTISLKYDDCITFDRTMEENYGSCGEVNMTSCIMHWNKSGSVNFNSDFNLTVSIVTADKETLFVSHWWIHTKSCRMAYFSSHLYIYKIGSILM